MNATERDRPQEAGHSESYSAESKNDCDQRIEEAIGRLYYARAAVEDVDGRRAIESAVIAARREAEGASNLCYPVKAGHLASDVEMFGYQADRAEEAIAEAIEILRDVETEGSR